RLVTHAVPLDTMLDDYVDSVMSWPDMVVWRDAADAEVEALRDRGALEIQSVARAGREVPDEPLGGAQLLAATAVEPSPPRRVEPQVVVSLDATPDATSDEAPEAVFEEVPAIPVEPSAMPEAAPAPQGRAEPPRQDASEQMETPAIAASPSPAEQQSPPADEPPPPAPPPPHADTIASALDHLPADSQLVITAAVGTYAQNRWFASLAQLVGRKLEVWQRLESRRCLRDLAPRTAWLVYAVPSFVRRGNPTLIAHGSWRRREVERCLDGHRLAWLSDRTVRLTLRDDEPARGGPTRKVRTLLADMPEPRAMSIAIDGSGGLVWFPPVPTGSDAAAWVRLDGDDNTFGAVLDPHDPDAVDELVRRLRDSAASRGAFGFGSKTVDVARDGDRLRIRGRW
ncbi:MAG: hypothetical protein KIT31_40310, partial [Deltaproteobacteria bacterium]|nr:hypothetical protein [Deltaproteobacteria bacterium]